MGARARTAAALAVVIATAGLATAPATAAVSGPGPGAGVGDTASLGDLVWLDLDRDGRHDRGEPGLRGVVVRLTDAAGQLVPDQREVTDADGGYLFTDLVPGSYGIAVSGGDGRRLTVQGNGRDAVDSDVDPRTGRSEPVLLAPGQTDDDVDAGFLPVFDLDLANRVQGSPQVRRGERASFSLRVRNRGADGVRGRIRVADDLPPALELVGVRGRGWACRGDRRADRVRCVYGRVVPGGGTSRPAVVTVRVRRDAGRGPVVNAALLQELAGETDPGSDTAAATLRVR